MEALQCNGSTTANERKREQERTGNFIPDRTGVSESPRARRGHGGGNINLAHLHLDPDHHLDLSIPFFIINDGDGN